MPHDSDDTRTKASKYFDPHREKHDGNRARWINPLANLIPTLPGLPSLAVSALAGSYKTYAAWPVWRDSTTARVKWQALPKRKAVWLYHAARRFERQTRQPGRQDGALGRNGLAVLHAMLFDLIDYASGQLDPGYAKLARKACISVRSVARGLANLKLAGVLNWVRRSKPTEKDGRFLLKQDTNAYAVLPTTQWQGFVDTPEAPPPDPATWGACPPLPDQLTQAVADRRAGDGDKAVLARLADDPGDTVAVALAGLFGRVFASKS